MQLDWVASALRRAFELSMRLEISWRAPTLGVATVLTGTLTGALVGAIGGGPHVGAMIGMMGGLAGGLALAPLLMWSARGRAAAVACLACLGPSVGAAIPQAWASDPSKGLLWAALAFAIGCAWCRFGLSPIPKAVGTACTACEYPLVGDANICPECGTLAVPSSATRSHGSPVLGARGWLLLLIVPVASALSVILPPASIAGGINASSVRARLASPDMAVQQRAVDDLIRRGRTEAAGLASDPNERVRRNAVRALRFLGPECAPDLMVALRDQCALVRLEAALGLQDRLDEVSREFVERALDQEADVSVRAALLRALHAARGANAVSPKEGSNRDAPES